MSDISNIKIVYIPEIFPTSTFENQKFWQDGEIMRIDSTYEISLTEKRWSLSWDDVKTKRTKEAILNERYKVDIFVYERTDLPLVMSDHCIFTDSNGIDYNAYDVQTATEQKDGKFKVTLTFTLKTVNNISYPLSHSNSELLRKNGKSINKVIFGINNIPFIETTTISWDATNQRLDFEIPVNDITREIELNDVYAFHSNVKELQGVISQAKCFDVQSDTISFYLVGSDISLANTYNNVTVQLDTIQEITRDDDLNITPRYKDITIYTQIKPKISASEKFNQELEFRQGVKEWGDVTTYDTYDILFFLKDSNMYLSKYLFMADTIKIEYDDNTVYAEFRRDTLTKKENNLTDQYEFELTLPVNVYNRNLQII